MRYIQLHVCFMIRISINYRLWICWKGPSGSCVTWLDHLGGSSFFRFLSSWGSFGFGNWRQKEAQVNPFRHDVTPPPSRRRKTPLSFEKFCEMSQKKISMLEITLFRVSSDTVRLKSITLYESLSLCQCTCMRKDQQQQPNYIFFISTNDFYFTNFSNREKIS